MTDQLPQNWEKWPLADIGQWLGGGTPSSSNPAFWDGNIPWVAPKDMKVSVITSTQDRITEKAIEESAAKLISAHSVLFVTRSGILAHSFPVATTGIAVTVNQDLKAIIPVEVVAPDYLAWALRYLERHILHSCTKHGTTVHSVEIPALKSLKVPVPPYREQRRIVARVEELFSELDKGIEVLKTVRQQLTVYRHAILKYAFSKIEATRPLPEVLAQPMSNGYSGKPVSKQTPWRVLSLSATTSGTFSPEHFKYLDERDLDNRDIWCEPGDILVQRGNTKEYVGVSAICTGKSKEFIFPDLMIRLRANRELISPEYLWYALSTPALRNEMRRKAKGSAGTMPKINQKILAELEIPYCKLEKQQCIVQYLGALASQVVALETEMEVQAAKSAALRQSILQQAFSGQLLAQDPNDEPASVLLERIRAEEKAPRKRRNRKNGKKKAA